MIQQLFNDISSQEKTAAVENLFKHSAPSKDFFLMVILSVLMATFGLLTDNSAVIVGSMLIAPILYPILGLAMGIIMSDLALASKSFITLARASVLGVLIAAGITLLFSSQTAGLTEEIISRTRPTLLSAAIGAAAGLAAAFSVVKPKLNEALPGVAISVALIPPLAVVGIGIARLDFDILLNSLLLFIINSIGVVFTAAVVFSFMNFYVKRRTAKEIVKEEEKKLQENGKTNQNK